jgi:hypothetical protein
MTIYKSQETSRITRFQHKNSTNIALSNPVTLFFIQFAEVSITPSSTTAITGVNEEYERQLSGNGLARERARNPWRDPGCGIVRSSLLPCDVVSATTVIAARNTTPCLAGFLASRNAIPQSSLVVLARQKGHNKIDDASARQMLHDAVQDEGGHSSPVAKALNECAQDCQGLTTATPVG